MARLGMVVDLSRCVGCGACTIACKAENNTRTHARGQSHNWGDLLIRTEGKFPNVRHTVIPVSCNHCSDAPCVKACPVEPKAMYKTPDGVTMHDDALCIGCRACQDACPYSHAELTQSSFTGETYSVISFNPPDASTQPQWQGTRALIPGCTSAPADVAKRSGAAIPAMNQWAAGDVEPIRRAGVVEKCTFCYQRVTKGLQPACVDACPARARIFGDQDDPNSEIARVLKARKSFRLQEDKGTRPNVHYVGKYSPRA